MPYTFYLKHCVHFRYACEVCNKAPAQDAGLEAHEEWAERVALDALFEALNVDRGMRQQAAEALADYVENRIRRTHRYEDDE